MFPVQIVGAPGADRPSHGLGRHPGPTPDTNAAKRTLRQAATPRQEKLPGGSLGDTTLHKGRWPAVHRYSPPISARQAIPRWRIAPERGGTKNAKLSKRSWTRVTEPEPSNRSEPTSPRQRTRRGRGRGVPSLGIARVFAVTSLSTAAAAQLEAAEVLGGPPGIHPARIGTGTPQHRPQAPNRQERTDHRRRDGWRLATVKGSPTRSWWSARQRSSSARWGARCWS